jgi:hypothetical protein
MKYLFIILPFALLSQPHPAEILKLFDQPVTLTDIYHETGSTVAPWLSWRYNATQSIAIDILCTWEELQVLIADRWILEHDLWMMFNEAGPGNLETIRRGNRVQLQIPGQFSPMPKYYTIQRTSENVQMPLGTNGWWGRVVSGGVRGQGGKLPIAIKQVGNQYILSAALIMKQTTF